MECNKCGKEIALTNDMVHCPYCGNELGSTSSKNKTNVLTKEIKINDSLKEIIVWLLLCGILVVFVTVFGQWFLELVGIEIPGFFTWVTLVILAFVAAYFTLAYAIYNHAKKNNRRAVAWSTAFIVFTPILAGLFYLLSWPKEQVHKDRM